MPARPYWVYARNIHDSVKHLLSIINQILDISRIDAGERELKDSVVDIPKVAGICVEIVTPIAKSGNLTLLEVGFEKAPKVIGEEIAIKQMLINLLTNAVKIHTSWWPYHDQRRARRSRAAASLCNGYGCGA